MLTPSVVPGFSAMMRLSMASSATHLAIKRGCATLGLAAVAVGLSLSSASAAGRDAGPLEVEDEAPETARAEDDEALLEFHFRPVANLQISIWLEDSEGQFLEDIYVTQATAKLGIGNRPGRDDFLSSWRAPYGPRPSVLPVWAHARGATYPKIIFHDGNVNNHTSLGFHESSSSPETYFCRPLSPTEDEAIVDTMTCPSPATFQSDKGEIAPGETSVYPPRNDLTSFEEIHDGPDPHTYADINDLDAVSRATPVAGDYLFAHQITRGDMPEGPIVAWIEVSLENDQNADWQFDREDDHWVDPKLPAYGREYYGQPAVLYRVEFDPSESGYTAVSEYHGYSDWDGATGTITTPDSTISTSGGSGADRLQVLEKFGVSARFGVYSHGWGNTSGDGDGDGDSGGDGDGDGGGGGACQSLDLPPVEDLVLEATAFNQITATFRLPSSIPEGMALSTLFAAWITPETDEFQLGSAHEVSGLPRLCRDPGELECLDAGPGDEVSVVIDQLFGNYSYSIGVFYEDVCTNRSEIAVGEGTTPVQPFQTIDGACFIATAAWGAGWTEELRALRWFRDNYMRGVPVAGELVQSYYAYGPILADMIRDLPPARAAVRGVLRPIADLAKLSLPD